MLHTHLMLFWTFDQGTWGAICWKRTSFLQGGGAWIFRSRWLPYFTANTTADHCWLKGPPRDWTNISWGDEGVQTVHCKWGLCSRTPPLLLWAFSVLILEPITTKNSTRRSSKWTSSWLCYYSGRAEENFKGIRCYRWINILPSLRSVWFWPCKGPCYRCNACYCPKFNPDRTGSPPPCWPGRQCWSNAIGMRS